MQNQGMYNYTVLAKMLDIFRFSIDKEFSFKNISENMDCMTTIILMLLTGSCLQVSLFACLFTVSENNGIKRIALTNMIVV